MPGGWARPQALECCGQWTSFNAGYMLKTRLSAKICPNLSFHAAPIKADQITLSSSELFFTLDKEEPKWAWERRRKWSPWGLIGSPIFVFYKECEICGWVLSYNPLLLLQNQRIFSLRYRSALLSLIPCSCYYSAYSGDGKNLPANWQQAVVECNTIF